MSDGRSERAARPSARKRMYDTAWDRARKAFLDKHTRCIVPGCTQIASRVDHHPPHKGDRQAFWDRTRWRPMCERHHNQQTARFDGGFGRAAKAGDVGRMGCDADGAPRDPNHPWSQKN